MNGKAVELVGSDVQQVLIIWNIPLRAIAERVTMQSDAPHGETKKKRLAD